ncbi:MAG: uracil-DNA glycosylase family protein [Planctomycetota bacterium]|nr:uracil-DNA glycosylase family protein [Planctomycetota bacterium]
MVLSAMTLETVAPLRDLSFPSVACVYDPLDYAWDVHRKYLERYGQGRRHVLMVGMNPGPYGMVQTGVPFGEVEAVRSWLQLHGEVRSPQRVHPKRPVMGFACARAEVSGRRMWRWAAHRYVTPERFFRKFFIHNYCPLAFVADSGANVTPDKLPLDERSRLFPICDRLLLRTVAAIQPRWILGIGVFAEERVRRVIKAASPEVQRELPDDLQFGRIPHPSPASPAANRGWEPLVDQALADLGLNSGGVAAR